MVNQQLNEVLDIHSSKSYEYQVTPAADLPKWATPIELEATFKTETGKEYAIRFYKDKQYGTHTRCVVIMLRKENNKWSQKAHLDAGTAKKAIVTMMKAYHEYKTSNYGKTQVNAFALFLQPDIAKYASVINAALERGFRTDPIAKLKLYAASDEGLKANATGLFYINPTNKSQAYFAGKAFDSSWQTTALALSLKPASEQVPASDVQHDQKALAADVPADDVQVSTDVSNFDKLYKSTAKNPLYIKLDKAIWPFGEDTLMRCYTTQKTALGDKCLIKTMVTQKFNTVPSATTEHLWVYKESKFTILSEQEFNKLSLQYSAAYNNTDTTNKPAVNSIYHVGDLFYSHNIGANIRIESIVYLASEKDVKALPGYNMKPSYAMSLMNQVVYIYVNMNTEVIAFTSEEKFVSLVKSDDLTPQVYNPPKPTEALFKKGMVFTTNDGLMKIADSVFITDYDTYMGFVNKHQKVVDAPFETMKGKRFYIMQAFATDYKHMISEDSISQLLSNKGWSQVDASHPLLQLLDVQIGDIAYIRVLETMYLSGDYELSHGDVIRCEKTKVVHNSVFVSVESVNTENKIIDLGGVTLTFGMYDKFEVVTSKEYQLKLDTTDSKPNVKSVFKEGDEFFSKNMDANIKIQSIKYIGSEEDAQSLPDYNSKVSYAMSLMNKVVYVYISLKTQSVSFVSEETFVSLVKGGNLIQQNDNIPKFKPKKYNMGQLIQSANGSVFKITDGAFIDSFSMFKTLKEMYPNLIDSKGVEFEDMQGLIWYVLQDQEDDELILTQENTLVNFIEHTKTWKLLDSMPTPSKTTEPTNNETEYYVLYNNYSVADAVYLKINQTLNFTASKKSVPSGALLACVVADKDETGVDVKIVEYKSDKESDPVPVMVYYTITKSSKFNIIYKSDYKSGAKPSAPVDKPTTNTGDVYIHMLKPSGSSALPQGVTAKVFGKADNPSQVPDNLNISPNIIANASYPVLIVVPDGAKHAVLVPTSDDGTVFMYAAPNYNPTKQPEKLKPTFAAPATNDSTPVNLYEGTFDAMVASQKVPPEVELFPGVKLKLAAYDFVTLGKTLSTLKDNMGGAAISKDRLDVVMSQLNNAADHYGRALDRIIIKSGKYIHPQNTDTVLKGAINYYTGSGYAGMNKALRSGNTDSSFSKDIAHIDEAYRQYGIKFPKDFVVYRGASISNEELEALQQGKAYEMASYSSASLNPRVGRNFAKYEAVPALDTMVNGELGAELSNTGINESRQGNKIFMAISGLDQTLSIYIARVSNFEDELELLINRGTFVKKNGELVHIHTSKSNKTRAWYGRFRVVHTTNEGRLVDVLSLLEQVNPEIGEIVDTMDKVGLLQYFIQLQLDDLAEEQAMTGL